MSLDLLIVCAAILLMAAGLSKTVSLIRSGLPEKRTGSWGRLFKYILGHKKILKNPVKGTLHLAAFWGCILPVVVIVFAQTCLTLPAVLASVLSLILDIVGIVFLTASVIFIIKRLSANDPSGPKKSLLPLFILFVILVTGFLAEGFRLSITGSEKAWEAPVGGIVSILLPASPLMMQIMIKIHLYALLLLITLLPFTFFRHLFVSPLNIFYKRNASNGKFRNLPQKDGAPGAGKVNEFTWKQLLDAEACVSCGRCEDSCPAFISGKPLSPKKIVRHLYELAHKDKNALLDTFVTPDEIWSCTTCMACVEACPVFAAPLDKIVDMRRHLVMGKGKLPAEAVTMIRDLELYGDVNGKGVSLRADWAMNRGVKVITPDDKDVEVVIWTGCSGSFHPRYQDVSRALVSILQKAGVNFRILGNKELCCGDPARRLGEEELFLTLAEKNLKTFKEYNIKQLITLCPHCFNTLKNEYPKLETGVDHKFNIVHASQFVMKLINIKKITPVFPLDKKVTVHDPCYLGRGNNIYEPLRGIINSVPGAELTELERSRENGFCCGAGGGGMWLHENLGKRLNVIRSEEIAEKNVDVVCTSCPYCQTMIDDGINGLELDDPPEVVDIIEMVERALR